MPSAPPEEILSATTLVSDSKEKRRHTALSVKISLILLSTSQRTVFTRQGEPIQTRILKDNDRQNSFETKSFIKKLKFKPYKENFNISEISENSTVYRNG